MGLEFKSETTKDKLMMLLLTVAIIYLINPTFGLFEFLPDNLPLIGNLDEGLATTIILYSLNYFGFEIPEFFKKKFKR
ncbi:MAG: DUF1232 domain-containing protein [Chitinophagaceae bacterium]|nr:DUF1232 domain-containing protein [Chitinophagaceae bacterium]